MKVVKSIPLTTQLALSTFTRLTENNTKIISERLAKNVRSSITRSRLWETNNGNLLMFKMNIMNSFGIKTDLHKII